MGSGLSEGWEHGGILAGGEESGSRMARMPTLATMRLSRRWGPGFCSSDLGRRPPGVF